MTKGGWTRVMNRISNTNEFYRGFSDYKTGFGDIIRNHWLGFNSIKKILSTIDFMVRFEFENSQLDYFEVDLIKIGSESQNFILTLGKLTKYSIEPNLKYHNRSQFRTFDNNLDGSSNCSFLYQAGWWFNNCYQFCTTCVSPSNAGHLKVNDTNWRTYDKFKILIKRKI